MAITTSSSTSVKPRRSCRINGSLPGQLSPLLFYCPNEVRGMNDARGLLPNPSPPPRSGEGEKDRSRVRQNAGPLPTRVLANAATALRFGERGRGEGSSFSPSPLRGGGRG